MVIFWPSLFTIMKAKGKYEITNELDAVYYGNLVRDVSHRTGLTIKESNNLITTVFDSIKQFMYDRTTVNIPNFGKFTLRKTKGKVMNNFAVGAVYSPPHYKPRLYFSPFFLNQIRYKVRPDKTKTIERLPESERINYPIEDIEEYLKKFCIPESTQD